MKVHDVSSRKDIMEFPDADRQFLFKVFGVKITDRDTKNFDVARLVAPLHYLPIDFQEAFVIGGLQIQNSRDAPCFEGIDFLQGLGVGANEEIRADLVTVHSHLKSYSVTS